MLIVPETPEDMPGRRRLDLNFRMVRLLHYMYLKPETEVIVLSFKIDMSWISQKIITKVS